MKTLQSKIISLMVAIAAIGFFVSCSSDDSGNEKEYSQTTRELIDMVNSNAQLKELLVKSIEKAKEINPDKETNPAQTLDEYYDFVEWSTKAMPWSVIKQKDGISLYDRIDQSLNYFYFINDIPLDELDGQGLYNNSITYIEPYRTWLINYTKAWGEYLSTSDSWNESYYQMAYEDESFGLQKGWYESKDNWHSFNDFFTRYLSSSDVRPIASPNDDSVVASPADAKPQGIWNIDENSDIVQKDGVTIKSKKFNSIPMLIGDDSNYKNAFANGTLTHTFLDVNDYHRYHFPMSGTIKEMRIIPGDEAVGGWVTWDETIDSYVLESSVPGWQMIETRGLIILDTPDYGTVALMPIGMSQICSVNFESNLKVGDSVKKGDMLGYFLFGGSDFVMIFQEGINFSLTAPTSGSGYQHLLMGEEYGRLSNK